MKRLLLIHALFLLCREGSFSQNAVLHLYETAASKNDTSLYVTIQKANKGISFVFPVVEGDNYYTLKDSVFEKHSFPSHQTIFGPYSFKRTKDGILFQDKNTGNRYRGLYNFSEVEHLAPDLFSSATDSYNITTALLDSNATVPIEERSVSCYKFLQIITGHNPIRDKTYRVLYIDKANLLPCRMEYYSDKERRKLEKTIFLKS
jgi:hypothetical protein